MRESRRACERDPGRYGAIPSRRIFRRPGPGKNDTRVAGISARDEGALVRREACQGSEDERRDQPLVKTGLEFEGSRRVREGARGREECADRKGSRLCARQYQTKSELLVSISKAPTARDSRHSHISSQERGSD